MIARLAKRFRDWLAANDSTPHPDYRPVPAAAVGVQRLADGSCYVMFVGRNLVSTVHQLDRQLQADLLRGLQSPSRFEPFAPVVHPWN